MNPEEKITTHIVATVKIEFRASGPWGTKATIGEMVHDAERAAQNIIDGMHTNQIRVIGKPTFHAVSFYPEDRS